MASAAGARGGSTAGREDSASRERGRIHRSGDAAAGELAYGTAARPRRRHATAPATYLNVFTVEELENNGRKAKSWSKIPAAFPIDGRLIVLPPDNDENRSNR
jgi:hypothetical protein